MRSLLHEKHISNDKLGKGLSQADRRVVLIQAWVRFCIAITCSYGYVRDLQGSTLKHFIETPHSKVFFSELVREDFKESLKFSKS